MSQTGSPASVRVPQPLQLAEATRWENFQDDMTRLKTEGAFSELGELKRLLPLSDLRC